MYKTWRGDLVSVEVGTGEGGRPALGPSQTILEAASFYEHVGNRAYDVSEDGRRFLMIQSVFPDQVDLILATDWLGSGER